MSSANEIISAAMALDLKDRAEVAYQLILSLESQPPDEGVEEAWAEEIVRRVDAIRSGKMPLRDWDEAVAEIQQALAKRNA